MKKHLIIHRGFEPFQLTADHNQYFICNKNLTTRFGRIHKVTVFRQCHSGDMRGFILTLPILYCASFGIFSGSGFNISPKIFEVNGFGPCPEQNELLMQFNITKKALPQRNKFSLNGTILVLEKISGPIEVSEDRSYMNPDLFFGNLHQLHFRTQRCTLDMTHCEDFDTLIIPEICSRLREKNVLWSDLIRSIRPKFGCPFRKVSKCQNVMRATQ